MSSIPTYAITLPQRRERLEKHFAERGVHATIFSAFDGKKLGLKTDYPYLRDWNDWAPPYGNGTRPPFYCGAGVHGLNLSYFALAKLGLAMRHTDMLILEDDVVLCDDFKNKLHEFRRQLPDDYLFAHLGSDDKYCVYGQRVSPMIVVGRPLCTEAVLYSAKALEIIDAKCKLEAPFDVFLVDSVAEGRPTHIAHPFKLAYQLSAREQLPTTLS